MTLQKVIHNVVTGEIITRDYNADEIAQHDKDVADAKARADADKAAATAKQVARQAVLDKLGLTSDEITALLG